MMKANRLCLVNHTMKTHSTLRMSIPNRKDQTLKALVKFVISPWRSSRGSWTALKPSKIRLAQRKCPT